MSRNAKPGRGRPPGRKLPIQFRVNLSQEMLDQIKRLAEAEGVSAAEYIREAIRLRAAASD